MTVYTHGHHPSVLRSHAWRTAENSAAYLLPQLRQGDRLLDVGCGPGTITADLAAIVAPGRVTGLDPAESVLAQARDTAVERGLSTVEYVVGDVYQLEFPDDTFDVVHAHQVLQHLTDPVRALVELRRVVRPGGVVAVRDSDYGAFTWFPGDPALDRWLAVYRAVARRNGAEPDAGRRLLSWAQRAGFTEVTATASVWCFASSAERTWWTDMWAERIVASSIADQAVQYGLSTPAELAEMARAWRRLGAAEDGWFLVPHGEVLARG
jgi:ubiquinone/menaquinone biosynthesis C-methylase UbiE